MKKREEMHAVRISILTKPHQTSTHPKPPEETDNSLQTTQYQDIICPTIRANQPKTGDSDTYCSRKPAGQRFECTDEECAQWTVFCSLRKKADPQLSSRTSSQARHIQDMPGNKSKYK